MIQCKAVTRFPGIPLTPFPVLPCIIPVIQLPGLLLPVILCILILDQCPGIIKRIIVVTRCPPLLRSPSLPAPLSSIPTKKRRSRRRRMDRHAAEREARNSPLTQDASWANQRAAVPAVPAEATQLLPETSNPHRRGDGSVPAFPECR